MSELVESVVADWWGHFKLAVLRACDEVCGKKRVGEAR